MNGPTRQISVIHSDGTGLQQITSFPEAVTEVLLSGDGSVAFAVTAANRIVRLKIGNAQPTARRAANRVALIELPDRKSVV